MATWRNVEKTQQGLNWAESNTPIVITKIMVGSGRISVPTQEAEQLVNARHEAAVTESYWSEETGFKVGFEFSSESITEAFYYSEFGIFAKENIPLPEEGEEPAETEEYLYCYSCIDNSFEPGDFIDSTAIPVTVTREAIYLKAANSDQITINISEGDYATKAELQTAEDNLNSEIAGIQEQLDNFTAGLQTGDIFPSVAISRKGALLCDGSEYDAADYPKLAALVTDFDVLALESNLNSLAGNTWSANITYSGSAAGAFDNSDTTYWRIYSAAATGTEYLLSCEYPEAQEIEALRFKINSGSALSSNYTFSVMFKNSSGLWEHMEPMKFDSFVVNGIEEFFINLGEKKRCLGVRLVAVRIYSSAASLYVYSFQAGKIARFKTPNLVGRTVFGANLNSSGGLLGMASGALSTALTVANLASHQHTQTHTHTVSPSISQSYTFWGWTGTTTGSAVQASTAAQQLGWREWGSVFSFPTKTTSGVSITNTGASGSGTAFSIENPNIKMNWFIIHGEAE